MRELLYEVTDPMGLHARPASQIFMVTRNYECNIEIVCDEETVDGKSLLALMGLGATAGRQLRFRLDGSDEDLAEKALETVLSKL